MYDYTNLKVGFNGYAITGLPVIPEKSPKPLFPIWAIVVISFIVIGIIACLSFYYVQKKKNAKLSETLETLHQKEKKEEIDLDDY